jgi:hypothetical protein
VKYEQDKRDKRDEDGEWPARDLDEKTLAREALALPREFPPPRDLWTGIEARIAAKRRREIVLGRSVAGGSMLLAAAAMVLFVRTARSPWTEDQTPAPIASESLGAQPRASDPPPTAIVPEEASFRSALEALTPTFEQGERSLPEKDLAAVNASLHAIDAAILVTRTSLAGRPEDPDLRGELDAEYEQKIDTMNDVLEWTTRS